MNYVIQEALKHWDNLLPDLSFNSNKLSIELAEFFRQRMISLLEDSGIDIDIVQALVGETIPVEVLISDPMDIRRRAELLLEMRKTDELLSVQEVVTRASRLAAKSQLDLTILGANEVVDPNLFEKSSEHNMLKVLNTLEPIARSNSIERHKLMAKGLTSSAKALAEFFDGEESVLVMTDDPSVRTNRINLLRVLCNQASMLADFNQIRN